MSALVNPNEICEHGTFKDICLVCHRGDTIARLTAEVKRLTAALEPFAALADRWPKARPSLEVSIVGISERLADGTAPLQFRHCIEARAALKEPRT